MGIELIWLLVKEFQAVSTDLSYINIKKTFSGIQFKLYTHVHSDLSTEAYLFVFISNTELPYHLCRFIYKGKLANENFSSLIGINKRKFIGSKKCYAQIWFWILVLPWIQNGCSPLKIQ